MFVVYLRYSGLLTKNIENGSDEDTGVTSEVFIEYYNENIPDSFPRASLKALSAFQSRYPSLFKEDGHWLIEKHRKKFMDWMVSYQL